MKDQKVTKQFALKLYETMTDIRCFEETVKTEYLTGHLPGFVHLYIGEEGVAAGVCAALRPTDYIESTHRGHGHCIAKGADMNRMMAEIYGKESGLCKGKGGSMHIADFSVGMLGANGVVGGGFNLAAGAAFASKKILKNDRISAVFFGDGASNRGTFHEAANAAVIWKLPLIFVNEMNGWASTTPYQTTTSSEHISDRAAGYHMPSEIVRGNNVFEVYAAARKAAERARNGEGPTFIEAKTFRVEGHFVRDPQTYRSEAYIRKNALANDPILEFERIVTKQNVYVEDCISRCELEAVFAKSRKKVKAAKQFAESAAYPAPEAYLEDLYV